MKSTNKKQLLVVANAPSENTRRLVEAVLRGARHEDISHVETSYIAPLEAGPEHILMADAIILGTTENLAYMSGALKDFFDRSYYPVLEEKQGLPVACYIRAGSDGTGTKKAIETIVTGLKWTWVQSPLVCKGDWQEQFADQVETLGMTIAAQLDLSVNE